MNKLRKPKRISRGARPPMQARSRATLERFQQAAAELLADRRFEEATVQEIARRAGSSVGAFYTRFPDKEALLHHLNERIFSQAKLAWSEALDPARWKSATAGDVVEWLVDLLIEKRRKHRGLFRALSLYARSSPDAGFARLAAEGNRHVYSKLRALLKNRPGITHPNPERALGFAFYLIDAVTRDAILFDDTELAPERFSNETLKTELCRAIRAYLGDPVVRTKARK